MKLMTRFSLSVLLFIALLVASACQDAVNYRPPAGSTDTAITHYSFGVMKINGKDYYGDLIILPNGEIKYWFINTGTHVLVSSDLTPLITDEVKTIILGTGSQGKFDLADDMQVLLDGLTKKGIQIFVGKTAEAVKQFNATSKEGLLACFHLNC